jgi:hypothetical protein
MAFLETHPSPDDPLQPGGEWASFRIVKPLQATQLLTALVREETPLAVGFVGDAVVPAALWACDADTRSLRVLLTGSPAEHQQLELRLARHARQAPPRADLYAVAYQGGTKLQFNLPRPRWRPHGNEPMLQADWPSRLVRLPRRHSVRVRRQIGESPTASFAHPLAPDYRARLRVLNLSTEGCALWLPQGEPPLAPEQLLKQVEVRLDEESAFTTDLRVLYLKLHSDAMPTLPMGEAEGLRLGCRWERLSAADANRLEAWISVGKRRRDLVHLAFDV